LQDEACGIYVKVIQGEIFESVLQRVVVSTIHIDLRHQI